MKASGQPALHRLHNPADEPLHIVEVQCGDDLDEADIERLEDLYGWEVSG